MDKKYLNLDGLIRLVANLINRFAEKSHTHTMADITDLSNSQSLEWQLVGSGSGVSGVDLPDEFNELYIDVGYWATHMTFLVPKIALTNEDKYYIDGFYGSSSAHGQFYIVVSIEEARIYEIYVDGTNVTENCTITVYKR